VNAEHTVKIIAHDPEYAEGFVSAGSTLRVKVYEAAQHVLPRSSTQVRQSRSG
jgi:hypothetical protein